MDPSKETYFISINGARRGANQLARTDIAEPLFDTGRHRQEKTRWWPYLFLLMSDHLHALLSFPSSGKPLRLVVSKWKEWTAKQLPIDWQDDFFEHRLRRATSATPHATPRSASRSTSDFARHPQSHPSQPRLIIEY